MAFFVLWFPVGVVLPFEGWQNDLVDMCFNEVEYNCIISLFYWRLKTRDIFLTELPLPIRINRVCSFVGFWFKLIKHLSDIDASKGVRFYKIQNSNWDGIQVRDNNQGIFFCPT